MFCVCIFILYLCKFFLHMIFMFLKKYSGLGFLLVINELILFLDVFIMFVSIMLKCCLVYMC